MEAIIPYLPPLFLLALGFLLWLFGGRLLQPLLGVTGAVLGAGAGLSLGQLLGEIPEWIMPLTGLMLGIATALLLSRLLVILVLVLGLSIAFPIGLATAAGWSQSDIGIDKAQSTLQDNGSEESNEEIILPTGLEDEEGMKRLIETLMLANQIKKFWGTIGQLSNRVVAAWKELSIHPRNALMVAALIGLLAGVTFGSLAPKNGARMATAILGTLIMSFSIHALASTSGPAPSQAISLHGQTLAISLLAVSMIGFILQATLASKQSSPENKNN